ncbi:hypothetical protein [Curtobacterium sp. RRHDQ10]|uniref:hypothetical protein n=1 Tax=Curtobacterium phyllosphaerae TaxID=3413379 RepID=UPI003BF060A2
MTSYVVVRTPSAPAVVTRDVPFATVGSSTVVDVYGTGAVSDTVSFVTTGVGVGVGVGVDVFFGVVAKWCAVEPCVVLELAGADGTGAASVVLGWPAPYADDDPMRTARATPNPIAAAERRRGSRSHVERRKTHPYAAVTSTIIANMSIIVQTPPELRAAMPNSALIPRPTHVDIGRRDEREDRGGWGGRVRDIRFFQIMTRAHYHP